MRYERYVFILDQLERIGSEDDVIQFRSARYYDDDDTLWYIAGRYPEINTDPYEMTRCSSEESSLH